MSAKISHWKLKRSPAGENPWHGLGGRLPEEPEQEGEDSHGLDSASGDDGGQGEQEDGEKEGKIYWLGQSLALVAGCVPEGEDRKERHCYRRGKGIKHCRDYTRRVALGRFLLT